MVFKCPICGDTLHKIDHGSKGKCYFLCTVDTNTQPVNIDIGTGMAVDAYGCVKCGTIILQSNHIIGQSVNQKNV